MFEMAAAFRKLFDERKALPPKAELQARIQQIYEAAAERVARRELDASSEREDAE